MVSFPVFLSLMLPWPGAPLAASGPSRADAAQAVLDPHREGRRVSGLLQRRAGLPEVERLGLPYVLVGARSSMRAACWYRSLEWPATPWWTKQVIA